MLAKESNTQLHGSSSSTCPTPSSGHDVPIDPGVSIPETSGGKPLYTKDELLRMGCIEIREEKYPPLLFRGKMRAFQAFWFDHELDLFRNVFPMSFNECKSLEDVCVVFATK